MGPFGEGHPGGDREDERTDDEDDGADHVITVHRQSTTRIGHGNDAT